ncbi:MFS transporter [Leucobacter allii]|uniref:MFS transporter n=1 Tax=Leucobacter allii TaxID=2932247 RepID=A0ABY4FLK5_9MICO|nr:MFS transporter [Leucobacter allii]UOQ57159.1 MFS transporter [Leucobacter allii]
MSAPLRRQGVAAGILTVAVGLSVRFPITSVSPLLGDIGAAYALSHTAISVLSAIPVLLFGLASPLAPWLVGRFGLPRALALLLAALALATLLRPLAPGALFAGTLLVGAAIALLGILAPQIIRLALAHRGGFWTGVYTTSFGVSAAAGAALSVPLLTVFGGRVAPSLAVWAVPLLAVLALALAFGGRLDDGRADDSGDTPIEEDRVDDEPTDDEPTAEERAGEGNDDGHAASPARPATLARPRGSILRARGLWSVTGFFGCQALLYFSLTAWLPTIAESRGADPAHAGLLLAWMSVAGLPASLLAPSLASRERRRAGLLIASASLAVTGLLGLALAPVALMPLAVAILGLGLSSAFGLAIALIVFTAPSAARTAAFSAVSQGVGYGAAAAGPLVPGLLVGAGVDWPIVLLLLAGVAVVELAFGLSAVRARAERAS